MLGYVSDVSIWLIFANKTVNIMGFTV